MGYYLQTTGQITVNDIYNVWVFCAKPAAHDLNFYKAQVVFDVTGGTYTVPSSNLDIEYFYGKGPINTSGGGGGK